jgi:hypothetical protein
MEAQYEQDIAQIRTRSVNFNSPELREMINHTGRGGSFTIVDVSPSPDGSFPSEEEIRNFE